MSGSIILGCLVGVALILLALYYSLRDSSGDSHYALKVILLGFLLGIILLIGKVAIDNNTNCSWLVNNSTTVGSTSSYNYVYTCEANDSTVANTLYNMSLWVMRLVSAYLILVFAFDVISYFGGKRKKKIEGDE